MLALCSIEMAEDPKPTEEQKKESYPIDVETPPVVTEHSLGKLEYTASAGMLPLKNAFGEVEAGIFHVAYTKKNVKSGEQRPITFSFNGGPGSSSVWLHLGTIGPRRVELLADGGMPKPPYKLVENKESWLEHTDLVFIDPVGTGYSRAARKELDKKYWGLKGDIEAIGEFIRLYLTRNERWASPLFLVGESYGTTRAAGLAGYLMDQGISFNGISMVSSILNFQTARFVKGNDLPCVLFLPTYTATAWYHKKLSKELMKDRDKTLAMVEKWAANEYTLALAKGSSLTGKERAEVVSKLASFTGLSEEYVENSDLRINIHRFCKELLRSEKRTVGRLDSRYKGIDELAVTENPDWDPAVQILPPYTAMINDYLRKDLGYKTDIPYSVFAAAEPPLWQQWDWGSAGQGYPDTSEALRKAMSRNPYMKIFVASGKYDLATPYFATEYTLDHLGLDASLRDNIRTAEYDAGHMMYVHDESLKKLKRDIAAFYSASV